MRRLLGAILSGVLVVLLIAGCSGSSSGITPDETMEGGGGAATEEPVATDVPMTTDEPASEEEMTGTGTVTFQYTGGVSGGGEYVLDGGLSQFGDTTKSWFMFDDPESDDILQLVFEEGANGVGLQLFGPVTISAACQTSNLTLSPLAASGDFTCTSTYAMDTRDAKEYTDVTVTGKFTAAP